MKLNVAVEICLSPLLSYLKGRLSHAEVKTSASTSTEKGVHNQLLQWNFEGYEDYGGVPSVLCQGGGGQDK